MNRPRLRDEDVVYYDAFRSLGLSREYTQAGPLAISFREMKAFFEIEGLHRKEYEKYRHFIQLLDQVELKHIFEKSKRK